MFVELLKDGLQKCGLENQSMLLAVSGGADSVALLRGSLELARQQPVDFCVAHLDHGLRTQSADDARWVAALCEQLTVKAVIQQTTVERDGRSLEEAARQVRYDFLQTVAEQLSCSTIVTAHHAGDQVETVLHNLVRGTGISGLRGMQNVREIGNGIRLARPMLQIDRLTIDEYLESIGQASRVDVTNTDRSLTRSRIRHELIPQLEQEYNPKVRTALLRLAQQSAELEDTLNQLADDALLKSILEKTDDVVRLSRSKLASLPDHLLRHCFLRLWAQQSWPRQRMGFREWNRLAESCRSVLKFDLPDRMRVRCRSDLLFIERAVVPNKQADRS